MTPPKLFQITALVAAIFGSAAYAERSTVQDKQQFLNLVSGKTLQRPLVSLVVTPSGDITGKGAMREVKGQWTWKDGYFCRTLYWGGDDLGYNCQLVTFDGRKLTFTADQGAGRSAAFSLR